MAEIPRLVDRISTGKRGNMSEWDNQILFPGAEPLSGTAVHGGELARAMAGGNGHRPLKTWKRPELEGLFSSV